MGARAYIDTSMVSHLAAKPSRDVVAATHETTRFAVCINNDGYKASIEIGKLYRVIPDDDAASHGYIRIVDESGEDYGYLESHFFLLDVPQDLANALKRAA